VKIGPGNQAPGGPELLHPVPGAPLSPCAFDPSLLLPARLFYNHDCPARKRLLALLPRFAARLFHQPLFLLPHQDPRQRGDQPKPSDPPAEQAGRWVVPSWKPPCRLKASRGRTISLNAADGGARQSPKRAPLSVSPPT